MTYHNPYITAYSDPLSPIKPNQPQGELITAKKMNF